jgi:hypothetical protein
VIRVSLASRDTNHKNIFVDGAIAGWKWEVPGTLQWHGANMCMCNANKDRKKEVVQGMQMYCITGWKYIREWEEDGGESQYGVECPAQLE